MAGDDTRLDAAFQFLNNMASLGEEVLRLWFDAFHFWGELKRLRDPGKRERSLRAAVLSAAAGIEALTNFLAERIVLEEGVRGRKLTESEIDCLRERRKVLRNGEVAGETARYSSKDRFLLLFRLVSGGEQFPAHLRAELDSSFKTRDQLVHPKPGISIELNRDGKGEKAVFGFVKCAQHLSTAWSGKSCASNVPHTFASLAQSDPVGG